MDFRLVNKGVRHRWNKTDWYNMTDDGSAVSYLMKTLGTNTRYE